VTRIFLVRHGETLWHEVNRYAGRTDVGLTPFGHRQAERLGMWAAGRGLDAIWCSSLARARGTAGPAGRATGIEPHVDARLCEVDFGRGEGLTVAEMEQQFPEALQAFQSDPVANHLPDGEDPREAVARAVACLEDITDAHPLGRVLIVAHTTLIRLVLCHLLGVPIGEYRRVFPFVRNVAITELELGTGGTALLQYNAPLELDGAVPDQRPGEAVERAPSP
jgi:broad specificity phosphatase PhoE